MAGDRRPWLVEISYEDDDPCTFGPYTHDQAHRLVALLDAEVQVATDSIGTNHHPHGVTGAICYPGVKYKSALNTVQKLTMRGAVREANRESAARQAEDA